MKELAKGAAANGRGTLGWGQACKSWVLCRAGNRLPWRWQIEPSLGRDASHCAVKLAEPLVRPGELTVSVIGPGLPACVCTTARAYPIHAARAHTPP